MSKVVFLRGVMGRSGTNFVRDLLLTHPDCGGAREPVYEDFFLDDAHRLDGYVRAVSRRWKGSWGIDVDKVQEELLRRFGDGLLDFLVKESESRVVVAKSPSVAGLEYLDRLWPSMPAILLVRDGRAAVQSAMRSFDWSFEGAVRHWLAGARAILGYQAAHASAHEGRFRLLRYEDVVADPVGVLTHLASFLGLDESAVDSDLVAALPVRGSSTFGQQPDGQVHWKPVLRDERFMPQQPGMGLSPRQLRRFDRLAGPELRAFGYQPYGTTKPLEQLADPARTAGWWVSDRVRKAKRSARHLR